MQKITLTVGISNSGKSTWARREVEESFVETVEVNRDDIRIELFCGGDRLKYHTYRFNRENESLVTGIARSRADEALSRGCNIIISDTNLSAANRKYWFDLAESLGIEYTEKVFDTPLHTCLARNINRDITLPRGVLLRQYKAFRAYMGLPQYVPVVGKPDAIIVDIDGTIADTSGRSPFNYSMVSQDKPVTHIIDLVNNYYHAGYRVILVTGRDSACRADTEEWLRANSVRYEDLYMKEFGSREPDTSFKESIFWDHIYDHYNISLVLEDRTRMVDHWRAMGLNCLQVKDGDY